MRRYHARRDATTDAESAEAHAERVDTSDAWLVAADAWELVGQPERARFAILRQAKYNPNVITHARAAEIRQQIDGWNAAGVELSRGGPRRASYEEDRSAIRRRLGYPYPSNEDIGDLQVYEFLRDPPERLFAYRGNAGPGSSQYDHTFNGRALGIITRWGGSSRAFGRGPRLEHVTVRAINGFMYSGTCNLETGTYCKLRRGKAWLKR